MKVAKFPGGAAERIARSILTAGPATAPELARRLGLTPAAIRRTLASLLHGGLVDASARPPFGPSPTRGRGRPGQIFSLTDAGRAALGQAYDGLALHALRFLHRTAGDAAISAFARDWARGNVGAAGEQPIEGPEVGHSGVTDWRIDVIADRLNDAGYAVTVEPIGEHAVQLCQHACPVSEAAVEFPALCDAETEALSRALGRHVTRLATIAHGDGVCTTLIPRESPSRQIAPLSDDRTHAESAREVMA